MKNRFIDLFKSKIKLSIRGKNVERFVHKLMHNNIELLDIKNINRNEYQVIIYKDDYKKIDMLKSIYEVGVVDAYGMIKIKKSIKVHRYLLLGCIVGLSLLIFLTNMIFKIEVIHTSSEIRNFLTHELQEYGMDKYSKKKSFKEIEIIKNEILNKYPDKIEWLEIETVGVKYVVRVELREIINREEISVKRNVIAKKDALIKSISAKSGMLVKGINNYVKKGDVIISGNVSLNDSVKGTIDAEGIVFGEVWYTVKVEYPFSYYEERLTGKTKNILSLKILNKSYDLFSPFKNKKRSETIILKDSLLPIKLVREKQEEMVIIDQVLTEDEAIDKCILLATEKMQKELKENEYIINNKVLKVNVKENKVALDVFFIVYEDITDYSLIEESQE